MSASTSSPQPPTPAPSNEKYNLRQLDIPRPDGMRALSRREDEALQKEAKMIALKECHPFVKAYADCAENRTLSVAWACKEQLAVANDCMRPLRSEKQLDKMRMEFLSDEARHARRYASVEKTKGHNSPYTK